MDKKALYHTVAKAVRVEHDMDTDTIYLVFEITDEKFKQSIKKDWLKDIELKVKGRNLVLFDEDE